MLRHIFALLIFVALVPCAQAQDDKVFRALSAADTEKLLQDLKVDFKKSANKKEDEHYFDFVRTGGFKVRLTHFSPQEIMLDCVFRGMPIDKVNQWNTLTKLSRATWNKDASGEFTILEYPLDLAGGVTEGTIKQMLVRFDDELKKYEKFIGGTGGDDVVLATVGDDKLENVLKTMGINYQKKANAAGVMIFDFVMNEHKLRMYNFGGKDLMIDGHFRRITLDEANKYNLSRKFIRVVNYKAKEVEYTALEVNLDCEAGVSEGMIRHWIASFGEDVRHFSEYARKLQPDNAKKK